MTLKKGSTLGPYVIDVLLGAGGMGEVYRARDSRLDRTVAIKILTPNLTAGDERRARFEREARAISALSSPHICALYDIGRADDVEYLVMEHLEGETLAARLSRGVLPLRLAIRYAMEIAAALQHAHRAGITHRDLKPGNVMITASGVKLLDFGLAKLTSQPVFSDTSAPATIVSPITAEGTIVGTVLYMAPEQLEGKAVDSRTDLFALGVIMYEMVTGRRPFGGGSSLSIVAAILTNDPPTIRSVQPGCPPALERIILTALQKNPDDRWQSAHDVARQLQWLGDESEAPGSTTSRARWWIAAGAAAAIGAALAWGTLRLQQPPPRSALRLHLSPPDDIAIRLSPESPEFALSPDGHTLAFTGRKSGTPSIFLRPLDSFDARKLDGSDGATTPFWSSDGKWIGFSAHGKLWKTKVEGGGVPEALADAPSDGAVATWAGDTILFNDRAGGRPEIYRVSAGGGAISKQTSMKKGEWRHSWPHFLPDGRHFVYEVAATDSIDRMLVLASLDSSESSILTKNVSQTATVGADRLAFVRDGKLLAQRVDLKKGTLIGEPALIANNVWYFYPSGCAAFDAVNGAIVYRANTSKGRLVLADRKGTIKVVDDQNLFDEMSASFSPDGTRAAVTVTERGTGLGDIWIYDLARGGRDRFTSDSGISLTPVWTPDGSALAYSVGAIGSLPHVVRRSLASSTLETLTAPDEGFQFPGSFTADGSALFFTRSSPRTSSDIFRLDLHTKTSTPLLDSTSAEDEPMASPDGKWLAFTSNASGTAEVYLQSLVRPDLARIRISSSGGNYPRWRRDSGELFFISEQHAIMSVVPRGAGEWSNTSVSELFHAPDAVRYDASPDGQSFLMVEGSHLDASDSIYHVILNWQ